MVDEDRSCCPLLVLEQLSGDGNFDDWISHFETMASINGWDYAAKFQWMSVCMTGHAQTIFVHFQNQLDEVVIWPKEHY